jgi:hypothetical protein
MLNIVTIVDSYSQMNIDITLQSLRIIAVFLTKTIEFNKEILSDPTFQEILLEDVINVYTIQTDFERLGRKGLGKSEFAEREATISHLITIIQILLNHSKSISLRTTTYAYLTQILAHNDQRFKLEKAF